MRNRTRILWLTALGALVILGLYFALANNGKSGRLPITLFLSGPYSPDQAIYCATATNRTTHPIVVDGILFEWKYRSGRVGRLFAFQGWNHPVPPGGFVTTTCCVPVEAAKVRAATIDDQPGDILRLALWLHLDRYPKVFAWLHHKGVPDTGSFYAHRGAWMTNPQRRANGGSGHVQVAKEP